MSSWAQRRKTIYGGIAALIAAVVIGIPAFAIFYTKPSCYDGIQNGGEKGIDCGGRCQNICLLNSVIPATVAWTRYEKTGPGIYNMAAYIINPNADATALNVPYMMVMYDKDGVPIKEIEGKVNIPPKRNTLAFESMIYVNESIPASRVFQFTAEPQWVSREDPLKYLSYDSGVYTEDDINSSFTVTLKNTGAQDIGRLSVYVILKDKDQNVVGFSKTRIDGIKAGGSEEAPFTWPFSRNGTVISQEVLPVAE